MSFIESAGTSPETIGALAPKHYAPQDINKAKAIEAWLRDHDQSGAWLAKKIRKSSGTVSQVLRGKYPSPPTQLLDEMLTVLKLETERLGDGTPGYVAGSVHKLIFVVCARTRKHRSIGVLIGNAGVGKTRTLREVQQRIPQTLMVEVNPQMTAGSFLIELLDQLHLPKPAGLDKKFDAVVRAIKGTNYLLVVDEAEELNAAALQYVRRIRDKAGVGVILAGNDELNLRLKPHQGQFDKIRSRVAMWPKTMKSITRDDMDDMVRAALHDTVDKDENPIEASDEVLDALWAYCQGSARVLMEGLMTGLRDYVLGRVELTAKAVDQVAVDVLFMERRKP